jgi:hypothetical protein
MVTHPAHKVHGRHWYPCPDISLGPLKADYDEDVTLVQQLLRLAVNSMVDRQNVGMKLIGDDVTAELLIRSCMGVETSW